jgi:5-methylcytosine-specific restriction endonuclease McrA
VSGRGDWRALSGRQRRRITRLVYERDGGVCSLCHRPVALADASVDHVVPQSKGGTSALDNLALAHRRCNYSKGNRVVPTAANVSHDGLAWFF